MKGFVKMNVPVKGLQLLLALQVIFLSSNCCGDDDTPPRHFRRTSMNVNTLIGADPSGTGTNIVATDTLIKSVNSYGMYLGFELAYYGAARTATWGNTAFACSPPEPGDGGAKEKFTSLTITSQSNFDSAHPAGTPLNDLFYTYSYFNQQVPLYSITGNTIAATRFGTDYRALHLMLREPPELDSTFVFNVHVEMSDGTVFDTNSPKVTFRQ